MGLDWGFKKKKCNMQEKNLVLIVKIHTKNIQLCQGNMANFGKYSFFFSKQMYYENVQEQDLQNKMVENCFTEDFKKGLIEGRGKKSEGRSR